MGSVFRPAEDTKSLPKARPGPLGNQAGCQSGERASSSKTLDTASSAESNQGRRFARTEVVVRSPQRCGGLIDFRSVCRLSPCSREHEDSSDRSEEPYTPLGTGQVREEGPSGTGEGRAPREGSSEGSGSERSGDIKGNTKPKQGKTAVGCTRIPLAPAATTHSSTHRRTLLCWSEGS